MRSLFCKDEFFVLDFLVLFDQYSCACREYYNKNTIFEKSPDVCMNTDPNKTIPPLSRLLEDLTFFSGKTIILLNAPVYIVTKLLEERILDSLYIFKKNSPDGNFHLVEEQPWVKFAYSYSKKNMKTLRSLLLSGGNLPSDYKIIHKINSLGLDISISCTGVASRTEDGAVIVGSVRNTAGSGIEDDITRFRAISHLISPTRMRDMDDEAYLVAIRSADKILVEGGALDGTRGAYRLGRYNGCFLSNFNNSDIREFAPSALKKFITGYGKADKSVVAKCAKNLMGLPKIFPMNEDESDALALLYALENLDLYVPGKRPTKKTKKKSGNKNPGA